MLPFHSPFHADRQNEYIAQALESGHLHGDGPFSQRAVSKLSGILGVQDILLTPSASHALELAFFSMAPQDEVIIPAYNFPSAANAVLRGGGIPVLCDVDPLTKNIDPSDAERRITKHTKAICLTHYAGVACDMVRLAELCREYKLLLVEDAAQALGSSWQGKPLGSIGDMACISFHSTKNITCGEGGAYLHNNATLPFSLPQMQREKGTNRPCIDRATKDLYFWETVGSSHIMPEHSAAMLLAQLEQLDEVTAARRRIAALYDQRLAPLYKSGRLAPMHIPDGAVANGHIYYFCCRDADDKTGIRRQMADSGYPAVTHFVPLHMGSMGKRLGYSPGDFPHSEHALDTLLRLPIYPGLQEEDIDGICAALVRAAER